MSAKAAAPKPKTVIVKVKKKGAPSYMVSFGDMMTLILTFFILLVSMAKDQDFPVSIEVQLLGGDGKTERTTSNLCTPGTNVVMDGKLILAHCTKSSSKTYHGPQWVTAEVEVRGNEVIRHILDGEVVLEYNEAEFDPRDEHAKELSEKSGSLMLSEGTISLQSESHPVHFRKVELLDLSAE